MGNNKKNQICCLLIRPTSQIRSRQWWLKRINTLRLLAYKHLPKGFKNVIKNSTFSILLTKNKEIQIFNNKYRKKNKPTDILSFYLNKNEQKKYKYLGDIIISTEYVLKHLRGKKPKDEINNELEKLLVHGYLHLLGYDHKKLKEERKMFSIQNKLTCEIKKRI